MGRAMRKGCVCFGVFLCLSMNLLAGCKEKTVDYSMEGETESMLEENGISNTVVRGKKGVKQFLDEPRWIECMSVENAKGEEVPIDVGWDNVTVPDVDEMFVIEVQEPEFDTAYKKQLAERIFGDAEIYYNDLAHLPKKDIEERRERCQAVYRLAEESQRIAYGDMKLIAKQHQFDLVNVEGWKDIDAENVKGWKGALEQELLRYDSVLETAGSVYTPVSEYDVSEYLGTYSGIAYQLSFLERERVRIGGEGFVYGEKNENDCFMNCRGKEISFFAKDIYQVCPDEVKEVEGLYYENLRSIGMGMQNQCSLSEEEAEEVAQRFVDELKLDYSVYNRSEQLGWWTGKDWGDVDVQYLLNGYIFYFDAGIDSMSFLQFGSQETDGYFREKKKKSEESQYSMRAQMEVYVNDKGVIRMRAYNPIETLTISEGVDLLPLDVVKEIIMEQVSGQFEKFRFKFTDGAAILDEIKQMEYEFVNLTDKMELIYFRVRNKKNVGYYSYIPAWRLSGTHYSSGKIENQILINAIDGSVIDFYDEV